ncbi:MAG: dihydrodipicolinate synthase family protein, partial [Ruminococcus sp.]|nr:dihydrodipicolinate synthase family protein [Ruminococcus sp.]
KANRLLEFTNMLFCDVNPIPVKEALNLMGFEVGECRLPLVSMEQEKVDKLKASMEKIGLIK